jgi:putative flippase GtrA
MMRQLLGFGLVGLAQLLVDWASFVTLTSLGVAVAPANLAARVGGACLGFWGNGRFSFAAPDGAPRLGGRRFARYLLFWLAMTALSTLAVTALDDARGLHAAWLGKPLADAALAALGFAASIYWIYR